MWHNWADFHQIFLLTVLSLSNHQKNSYSSAQLLHFFLGTKEDGYLAYYEICQAVQDEDGWDVETPYPGVMGPYAHKDKLWVGFDDEFIVREKAHFVVEENLGGIMFWTIDNDDFRSACGPRSFPLIESAKEALYGKDAAIRT